MCVCVVVCILFVCVPACACVCMRACVLACVHVCMYDYYIAASINTLSPCVYVYMSICKREICAHMCYIFLIGLRRFTDLIRVYVKVLFIVGAIFF